MRWMASESMDEARKEKKARRKRPGGRVTLGGGGGVRQGGKTGRTERAGQPASLLVDERQQHERGPGEVVQVQAKRVEEADGLAGRLAGVIRGCVRGSVDSSRATYGDAAVAQAGHGEVGALGGEAASNAGHVHSSRNQNARDEISANGSQCRRRQRRLHRAVECEGMMMSP